MNASAGVGVIVVGAHDRGFLWRLRRGSQLSYLYGTVHLGRLDWMMPGPTVSAALATADVVALELDPLDPDAARRLRIAANGGTAAAAGAVGAGLAPLPASAIFESAPDGSVRGLPADLQARLDRQWALACRAPNELAALPALQQLMKLSVLSARWEGLDPAFSQEQALSTAARHLQRPVVALESLVQQHSSLMLRTPLTADETAEAVHKMLLQLETGAGRAVFKRISQIWEQGDFAGLEAYERWCDCAASDGDKQALRQVNDERNPGLAQRIEALHAQGQRVFAAVGALHLVGPRGLPVLLSERGFQVELVPWPLRQVPQRSAAATVSD